MGPPLFTVYYSNLCRLPSGKQTAYLRFAVRLIKADGKAPVCHVPFICRLLLGWRTAKDLFAVRPDEKQTAKTLAHGKLAVSSSEENTSGPSIIKYK